MKRRVLASVITAVAAVVLLVVALMAVAGTSWNPFRTQTSDDSGPVLVKSIQDLQRYVPAQGVFQVAVVLREGNGLPTWIYGYQGVLVAHGTVDAFVDFSGVTSDAVTVAPDRRSVSIRLPAPELEKPAVDHQQSEVVVDSGGAVDSVVQFFGGEDNKVQDLYRAAEAKIAAAASESDLRSRAEQNTEAMLQSIGRTLGFETVDVTFQRDP